MMVKLLLIIACTFLLSACAKTDVVPSLLIETTPAVSSDLRESVSTMPVKPTDDGFSAFAKTVPFLVEKDSEYLHALLLALRSLYGELSFYLDNGNTEGCSGILDAIDKITALEHEAESDDFAKLVNTTMLKLSDAITSYSESEDDQAIEKLDLVINDLIKISKLLEINT